VSWSKWHFADLRADWNWETNGEKPLQVTVFSSCQEAELFLNGKSLGRKPTNRSTEYQAVWPVPFAPGTLEAVGYDAGRKVTTAALRTAGAPDRIRLTSDRDQLHATGEDLSYITVELVDAQGVVNPNADNRVRFSFEIEGSGTIVGVGNANPLSLESSQRPGRKCWRGRCLVIVKAGDQPGKILVRAAADRLPASLLTLTVSP